MSKLFEAMRVTIENSEHSQNRISKAIGVHRSQLSRFMKGDRGLSIECLERLCEFLELEISIKPKRKKGK